MQPTHRFRPARLSLALTVALLPMTTLAAPDTLGQPGTQQVATADASPSWTSLDTITVTAERPHYSAPSSSAATRTDTPLLNVPQSVQVLNRSLIEEQDRRTLGEALVNVSGVAPGKPEEGLLAGPIVRGFLAEIYQDGLPMYGSTQAANDPTSLVGFSRIDVLKGPTSTLYGGGAGAPLGGLINLESQRPSDAFGGRVGLRVGSFSTVNPYAELDIPVNANVSTRIVGEYQRNDRWIDLLESERWFLQPGVTLRFSPQTDLWLQGQYSKRSQLEYSGLPAAQAMAGLLDRNAFPGAPNGQPHTEVENRMVTGVLRHAFSDDLRLHVSARWYDSEVPQYGTFLFPDVYAPDPAMPTVYPILPLNMMSMFEESTVDAHLQANADFWGAHHTLLVGIGYDEVRFYSDMGFSGRNVGEIDLADPVYDLAFGPYTPPSLAQTNRYRTLAAYMQDQASWGRFHVTGGLRFTQLRVTEREQGTRETWHRPATRIGASFDITPGIALYAGYASAFRAPFGFIGLQPPRPETSKNVEAGVKFALDDIGLSGTVAAYEQTREHVATPDPDNPLFYSVQTGEQRARGLEADLVWEPTPAFSLLANYAYTDAEVTQDNALPVGDALPRIPQHGGRIAARWRVVDGNAQGLSFGAGVTAMSARQITLPNSVTVPGHALIDAQASYDFDRFTVSLSALNLAGRDVFEPYQYFAFPVVMPTQPRSLYLGLEMQF